LGTVVLVTGEARSGKSLYAEMLVRSAWPIGERRNSSATRARRR
jgi:adenosyl cobinamide kinase/adenosyl cobinamide phosphate guanylyltransferase